MLSLPHSTGGAGRATCAGSWDGMSPQKPAPHLPLTAFHLPVSSQPPCLSPLNTQLSFPFRLISAQLSPNILPLIPSISLPSHSSPLTSEELINQLPANTQVIPHMKRNWKEQNLWRTWRHYPVPCFLCTRGNLLPKATFRGLLCFLTSAFHSCFCYSSWCFCSHSSLSPSSTSQTKT